MTAAPGPRPEPPSGPLRSAAVLAGAHTCAGQDRLAAVGRNLGALAGALRDPRVWGVPEERCAVIEQPADAAAFLAALEHAADLAEDTLVFYFAGRGLLDTGTGEPYLLLPGSPPHSPPAPGDGDTALPYASLRRILASRTPRARRTLIVLDCRWSAGAPLGTLGARAAIADRLAVEGACLLTAAGGTPAEFAPPGEQFTAFTGELLSVLGEGLAGGPEFLDADALHEEIRARLVARSRPLPQLRNLDGAGRIRFARNRAYGHPAGDGVRDPAGDAVRDAVPGGDRDSPRDGLLALMREADEAGLTGQTGDPAAAVRAYAGLARRSALRLGPEHPYTLRLRQLYADWTGIRGDPAGAARLYAVIAHDCARLLSMNHPTAGAARRGQRHWKKAERDNPPVWPERAAPGGRPASRPELPPLPAPMTGEIRSVHAELSTHIAFTNASGRPVHLYWLDYEGQAQLYRVLAPGESYLQQTYVSHPWIAVEPGGEVRAGYLPAASPARVTLR